MAKKSSSEKAGRVSPSGPHRNGASASGAHGVTRPNQRPSALVDTRLIYCGDNLEQLKKLPGGCIDLIYIEPPFIPNRNYEIIWGRTKEQLAFENRHGRARDATLRVDVGEGRVTLFRTEQTL